MIHIIIFVPLLGAALDIFDQLFTPVGRTIILVALAVGLLAAVLRPEFKLTNRFLRSSIVSLIGALFTFVLSTQLNLGAVIASAIVGLVGARVFKDNDQVVMYLGAFVGMSSALRFPTLLPLIVAGLLGGLFFELLDDSWVGVGGRLGTLAAAAVVVVLVVMGGV